MMNELTWIQRIIVWILPVVFAITVHEVAHGWAAKKYGDNTAYILGRLTLNPMKHIDWFGTVILPGLLLMTGTGFIFGWAKPVPINFGRLHNPKSDMLWVALAGPLANFAMALVWAILLKLSFYLDSYFGTPISLTAQAGISINISLMLLNLLPILPLDGGRIVFSLLPNAQANKYARTEPYGMFILIFLLMIGGLTYIIQPIYLTIVNLILSLLR
jgi:Zn-dependent protease